MADCPVIMCDVLCYLRNKYGKVATKLLKTMITDFYEADLLSEAKVRLFNDIEMMNLSVKLPHIPQRSVVDVRHSR